MAPASWHDMGFGAHVQMLNLQTVWKKSFQVFGGSS